MAAIRLDGPDDELPSDDPRPPWIPVAVASRLSGLGTRHLLNLIHDHAIEAYDARRPGSSRARWRVRRQGLYAFMNARAIAGKNHGTERT
ncbi:MAG: hypothetical protein U0900_02200 [Myxococcota bacterium]